MLVLAATAMAEYNGWSMTRVNQVENVPKTIRDNPARTDPLMVTITGTLEASKV